MDFNEYYKNMMNMQQDAMKYWQDQMEQFNKVSGMQMPFNMPQVDMAAANPFMNPQVMQNMFAAYHPDFMKNMMAPYLQPENMQKMFNAYMQPELMKNFMNAYMQPDAMKDMVGKFMQPELMQKMMEMAVKPENMQKLYDQQLENSKALMEDSQNLMQQWYDIYNKAYQDQLAQAGNPYAFFDLYAKMNEGKANYEKMANAWVNYLNDAAVYAGAPLQELEAWQKQYSTMFADSMISVIPSPLKEMVSQQIHFYQAGANAKDGLFQPWIDEIKHLQQLMVKSVAGDLNATEEMIQLWQGTFSNTFGRFLNLPVFSLNTADMKDMMDVLDSTIMFMTSFSGFLVAVLDEGEKTFQTVVKDYTEMVKNNEMPNTFEGFYNLWISTSSKAFKNLFGTDSFSKMVGQLMNSWARLKKESDEMVNNVIKTLPLPSQEDMDSVYKKLDTVRRDVRELKAQVSEKGDVSAMEKELATLKTNAAKMQRSQTAMEKELAEMKALLTKLAEAPKAGTQQ